MFKMCRKILYLIILVMTMALIAVSGQKAGKANVEYLVQAFSQNHREKFTCLGVVIGDRHVLTTASCVVRKDKIVVILGDSTSNDTSTFRPVVSVTIHDDFQTKRISDRVENSLAVLTIDKNHTFEPSVPKLALPRHNANAGEIAVVSGWTPMCNLPTTVRINYKTLTISDLRQCSNLRHDEFCVKKSPATIKVHYGSPVVLNSTIIGFTTFACSSRTNAVTNVLPHVKFIQTVLEAQE